MTDPESPVGRYFIVTTEVNKDDGNRSVKMGKAGAFGYKGIGNPDKDWQVPYTHVEQSPGVWKLTLKADLKPGEYGVWFGNTGVLYDFGVDLK